MTINVETRSVDSIQRGVMVNQHCQGSMTNTGSWLSYFGASYRHAGITWNAEGYTARALASGVRSQRRSGRRGLSNDDRR
jgi:hypothetical protein